MSDQPEPLPTTVDEAVQYLLAKLDEENRARLKSMSRSDLGSLHFGYGMGIRNSLRLWDKSQALLKDPEIAPLYHADFISHYLIEKLWEHLQEIDKG